MGDGMQNGMERFMQLHLREYLPAMDMYLSTYM
jgi:hypothetical protein